MTPANVLTALGKTQEEVAGMNKFAFVDCTTVDEALGQLGDGAMVKAGGIDLLDLMKDDIVSPPKLVNIRNIESLRGITADSGWPAPRSAVDPERDRGSSGNPAKIHGAVRRRRPRSHAAGAQHGDARRQSSCSGRAAGTSAPATSIARRRATPATSATRHGGENQYHAIMNNGTCAMVHPSSTAVPLLAMNAQVELTSKRGKRTVAMSEFYVPPEESLINETVVQPGELITGIFVPAPEAGTRSAYQKYGEKESFDWPLADAGVVLVMDGTQCRKAAIVLGVAAPTPIRSRRGGDPDRQDDRRGDGARSAKAADAGGHSALAERL